MKIKYTFKVAPLFIILSLSSTFAYSTPVTAYIDTSEKLNDTPIIFCKDYPLCKELPTEVSKKKNEK